MSLPVAGVFDPLIDLFEAGIAFFHDDLGFGWGVSIVCFTFVLRLLILPLSIRGIQKMRALQELQPYMKQIQEQFADDRERQQREMMKLFQERGVNPLASCFPLLLQMPFLLLMFATLRGDSFKTDVLTSGSNHGWLFLDNLVENPANFNETAILAVLFVITMMGASLVSVVTGPTGIKEMQPIQKFMIFGLPILFAAFVPNFVTGLSVYWITTNIWTVGQQFLVLKIAPPPVPPTPEELEAAKPPPPPPRKKRKKR